MTARREHARALASAADYTMLKRDAEARIERWEWASFTRHSFEPAYFEVHKSTPGIQLESEPDPPRSGAHGYGFTSDGALVVDRKQTSSPGHLDESFFVHDNAGIAEYRYLRNGKQFQAAAWHALDDRGRIAHIDTFYQHGSSSSLAYTYEGDRLVTMERRAPNGAGELHDYRDFEYDERGRIARVYWRYPDGRRVLDFARPDGGKNLAVARARLVTGLADAAAAALAVVARPVFALCVFNLAEEIHFQLPPRIAVGTLDDLERLRAENPAQLRERAWDPMQWQHRLALTLDDELAALCENANQDIWQNSRWAETAIVLAEIAARVGSYELPFARADDFVAYGTRLGHFAGDSNTWRDVASQASPTQTKQLRARSLL